MLGNPDARLNVDAIRTPYSDETLARMNRTFRRGAAVKGQHREQAGRKPNPKGARPRSFTQAVTGREKGIEHPCPMPLEVAESMVTLGSWPGDTVIDPFAGSGKTALAARRLGRNSISIERDPTFAAECGRRMEALETELRQHEQLALGDRAA